MSYEQREKSGILFRQEKRSERAPDFSGECTIGGVKYKIVGWSKTAKSGSKFLSLQFEDPNEKPRYLPGTAQKDFPDDDINF